MKPPYCFLCHKDCRCAAFHLNAGGGFVRFADFLPLPDGKVGHPQGLEWFCPEHLPAAKTLAFKNSNGALYDLQQKYGTFAARESYEPLALPELWLISSGPNLQKILGAVRQSTGFSPAQLKEQLTGGTFKVATGWPSELKPLAQALEAAGATVELRCP